MTAKKFGRIQGLVFICMFILTGAAFAASSGVWQEAQFNGIPGGGRNQYNYWAGSHKATISGHCSIRLMRKSPALPVYSALINGDGIDRSPEVEFDNSFPVFPETTAQKGYTYYLRVRSALFEPEDISTATFKFSSDNLR